MIKQHSVPDKSRCCYIPQTVFISVVKYSLLVTRCTDLHLQRIFLDECKMEIKSSSSSVGLHESLLGQVTVNNWHRSRQGSYFCMLLSGLVFLVQLCFGLSLSNTHRSPHLLKEPHAILLKQQIKVTLIIALFNLAENVKSGNNKGLTVLGAGQLAFVY